MTKEVKRNRLLFQPIPVHSLNSFGWLLRNRFILRYLLLVTKALLLLVGSGTPDRSILWLLCAFYFVLLFYFICVLEAAVVELALALALALSM